MAIDHNAFIEATTTIIADLSQPTPVNNVLAT